MTKKIDEFHAFMVEERKKPIDEFHAYIVRLRKKNEKPVEEVKFAKSPAARRVDFAQIKKDLNEKEDNAKKELSLVIRKVQNVIEHQIVNDGEIDMNAIRNLKPKYTMDIKQVLKESLRSMVKQGFKDVRNEIDYGKKTFAKTREQLLEDTWMTPKDAIDYIEEKSFMLAGIESDYIKKEVQLILAQGVKTGKTTKAIMYEIGQFFDQYDYETTGGRLETIVRTNTTEAYNLGRLSSMRDSDLEGFVQAVEYSAVMDDRTTDFCEAANGKIYAAADPYVDEITPPNHFNCRSIWVPVTEFDSYEVDEHLNVNPADGFYSIEKTKKEVV